MKTKIYLLLISLSCAIYTNAQVNSCETYQIRIDSLLRENRQQNLEIAEHLFAARKICLFANEETSQLEKLKPFSVISEMENGYAIARKFNQYVIIDNQFKVLEKLNYLKVYPFENGYAKVINYNDSVGLINTKGQIVIPLSYLKIEKIETGYVASDRNSITLFDDNLKNIWRSNSYSEFEVQLPTIIKLSNHSNSVLINNKGREILSPEKEYALFSTKNKELFVYQSNKVLFFSSSSPNTFEFDQVNRSLQLMTEDFVSVNKGSQQFLFNTKTFNLIPWEHQAPGVIFDKIIVVRKDGKYGVIDINNNNVVLPIEYDFFSLILSDKHIVFKKEDQFFFFDMNTKSLTASKYIIWDIINGETSLFIAKKKNYGIINIQQKEIFPFVYDTLITIDGFDVLGQKKSGSQGDKKLYYSKDLDILIEKNQDLFRVFNRKGEKINEFSADRIQLQKNEGVSIFKGRSQGFLSLDGYLFIPPKYDGVIGSNITKFQQIRIKHDHGMFWDGEKQILPIEYTDFKMFGGSYFIVQKGPLFGVTDLYGTTILPSEYERIYSAKIHNHLLLIIKKDNFTGLYDLETKQFILPVEYEQIYPIKNNAFSIIKDGKMGFFDVQGKEILPIIYDELIYDNSAILFSKDKKMGLVSMQGKVLTTEEFDQISFFRDGLAIVSKNKKVGVINEKGKITIPLKYDYIDFVGESRCVIKVNELYGLIDYSGNIIVHPIYQGYKSFDRGVLRFETDSELVFINPSGKIISQMKNSNVSTFRDR